jgi:hypothetical protein
VDVLIRLEREEPPVGTVVELRAEQSEAHAQTALPFAGWLGLLRALAEVVGEQPRPHR